MDNRGILRDLGERVLELSQSARMEEKRRLWRRQNSFLGERPLIYLRAFAFHECIEESALRCTDPALRRYERQLRETLFRDGLNDDFIAEPWIKMEASYPIPAEQKWGVPVRLGEKPAEGGAAAFQPALLEADFTCLSVAPYQIDEEETRLKKEQLEEALDGSLPVCVTRQGPFCMWGGDISTDLAKLRGLEQLMWDAYDRPEWLHSLLAFMRDSILKNHSEVEQAGGFSLADHQNQAMSYARELSDPNPAVCGVERKQLWWYMAAQEFTGIGPDMYWEFLLQYQLPILEKFGLVAYGCCEDLTNKIPYLKRIPNLRRIAVSPFADARKCAEQIGGDYILSWRPNPSLMLATGLDEEMVRRHLREHFAIFRENRCHFDITLKDVETVNHQPENIGRWVQIVREEIDRAF